MSPQDKAAEALQLADAMGGYSPWDDKVAAMLREYAALLQAQPAEAGRVPPADSVRRWIADFETSIRRLPKNRMALAETSLSQMRGWADTLSKEQPAEAAPHKWRPIDTAPKDGRYVVVWPPTWEGLNSCARWDDDRFAKRPRPYWSRTDAIGVRDSRDNPPTHWMPLQPPPKEQP